MIAGRGFLSEEFPELLDDYLDGWRCEDLEYFRHQIDARGCISQTELYADPFRLEYYPTIGKFRSANKRVSEKRRRSIGKKKRLAAERAWEAYFEKLACWARGLDGAGVPLRNIAHLAVEGGNFETVSDFLRWYFGPRS